MAKKYLQHGAAGFNEEIEATVVSTGAPEAGKIVALDAAGLLDESVMPAGVAADVTNVPSSENLTSGEDVNLWNDAGTLKVRKADASGGIAKKSDGYVKVNVTAPASVNVYHDGTNTNKSGLTIGSIYFLSATPGAVTTTPPTTATHISQRVGKATSTTALTYESGEPVIRA